jgi:hypothetical protein
MPRVKSYARVPRKSLKNPLLGMGDDILLKTAVSNQVARRNHICRLADRQGANAIISHQ